MTRHPKGIVLTVASVAISIVAVCFLYYSNYQSRILMNSIERLNEREEEEIQKIRDIKFDYLTAELDRSMFEVQHLITDQKVQEIEEGLLAIPELAYHFDNFNTEDNPIAEVFRQAVEGVYYNKSNDSNDPFIIVANIPPAEENFSLEEEYITETRERIAELLNINTLELSTKDLEEHIEELQKLQAIIGEDLSGECAVRTTDGEPKRTRIFLEEYPMHANPELAQYTFPNIVAGDSDFNFFQFQGDIVNGEKVAQPLESFDLNGIKGLYDLYEGDWRETFKYYEFQVDSRLYDNEDILGNKKVIRGVLNEDVHIVIYVMSYKFIDYIETRPRVIEVLTKYDEMENSIKANYSAEKLLAEETIHSFRAISFYISLIAALLVLVSNILLHIIKDE